VIKAYERVLVMAELKVLLEGVAFGESPRWHDGRLWFADWGAQEIVAVDETGKSEVELRVSFPTFPMCLDWLPDGGDLLVISSSEGLILRREADGSLVTYADLNGVDKGWNEIVVDGRGNAYVNGGGFDLMSGQEFRPGIIALVTPGGQARQVADGIAFPNGMAVTPDNSTLIIAESYGKRLSAFDIEADGSLSGRRVWADLGDGVPDGICIDAEGAVWYADVPNKRCVRVREGGQVLETMPADRGCFSCALGGEDGQTLFIVATQWGGIAKAGEGPRTGQVLTARVAAAGAGWP
jgi:sugar lactone lactonase YvrE